MSDVLDPGEVDALLAAVDKGDIAVEKSSADAGSASPTQTYDFERPDRVSKEQLRTLAALHETFARNVAANLSSVMRRVVETRLADVEQLTYGEFIRCLPSPTCLMALSARPLVGDMVMEINPSIILAMVNRLLGGIEENAVVPNRPLTDIESRLAIKIVDPLLGLLKEMWGSVQAIDFAVKELQANPQLLQAAAPHDPVVVVSFQVTMGEATGPMNLCIPYAAIEPVMGRFAPENWLAPTRKVNTDANVTRIAHALSEAELEVTADLAETQITVKELLDLQVGDLIKTDASVDSEATVYVEGKPKFKGRPGRNGRRKAALVSRAIEPGKTR